MNTNPSPSETINFDAIERNLLAIFERRETTTLLAASEQDCLAILKDKYRLIRISRDLPDDVDLPFLNRSFLQIAKGGHAAIGKATLGDNTDRKDGISYRSKAIARAIASGKTYILSPFTAQPEPVISSLGLEWYFHSINNQICFASQMGGTMVAVNLETVWVFPQARVILYVENTLSEDSILLEIARLYKRCITQAKSLVDYLNEDLSKSLRSFALTDFFCPHMSHNLWNIQTGWANVFARADGTQVRQFMLFENQNFFGDLKELFPESIGQESQVSWVKNNDDVFVRMLEQNLLLFTVKDEFFTKDFAQRVLQRARAKCSPEFLAEVDDLKAKATPLIITTIRLDNRAWIEQREGLPALFSKLREDFPRLGLIIDGLSSDTTKGWTTAWMSMEDELEVATTVKAALPSDMPVILSVGRTFVESIVLIDAADMFIAPSGSGMSIYKWISNLPGLAFSNRSVVDLKSSSGWQLRVWHNEAYRHDLVSTAHLDRDLVTDGDSARNQVTRTNFHVDWKDIYAAAFPLIESLK